jgi:hypothetical protein
MEEIACTYGYPMDSCDVSQIKNMSFLFVEIRTFNDYIWSCNVSNVTDMSRMLYEATSFNQVVGRWDTSHIT